MALACLPPALLTAQRLSQGCRSTRDDGDGVRNSYSKVIPTTKTGAKSSFSVAVNYKVNNNPGTGKMDSHSKINKVRESSNSNRIQPENRTFLFLL